MEKKRVKIKKHEDQVTDDQHPEEIHFGSEEIKQLINLHAQLKDQVDRRKKKRRIIPKILENNSDVPLQLSILDSMNDTVINSEAAKRQPDSRTETKKLSNKKNKDDRMSQT